MTTHQYFNISKYHLLSSRIAYSPANFNRVTRSTKQENQTLITPCHWYKEIQHKQKQITIIGLHDSYSQFLPLLLYKRLTLAVLSQYSTTLAYHDQNKLQHKQNTQSINIFHLLDISLSSLCSLQNKFHH